MRPITKIIPILLLLSFSAAGCGNKKPAEETQKKVSYEELTQDPHLSDALEEMDDESGGKRDSREGSVGTQGVVAEVAIVVTQGVLTKEETEP